MIYTLCVWAMVLLTLVVCNSKSEMTEITLELASKINQIHEWCESALAPAK